MFRPSPLLFFATFASFCLNTLRDAIADRIIWIPAVVGVCSEIMGHIQTDIELANPRFPELQSIRTIALVDTGAATRGTKLSCFGKPFRSIQPIQTSHVF